MLKSAGFFYTTTRNGEGKYSETNYHSVYGSIDSFMQGDVLFFGLT